MVLHACLVTEVHVKVLFKFTEGRGEEEGRGEVQEGEGRGGKGRGRCWIWIYTPKNPYMQALPEYKIMFAMQCS